MPTARIPISNVGQYGMVTDMPSEALPLNAWTYAKNIRPRDQYMEKFTGDQQVFGALSIAPYYAIAVPTPTSYFWVYAGLNKVYGYDGSHFNLTRQTGGSDTDYNASADDNWTSALLGGILILNNGFDPPQMWLPTQASQRLQILSTWPSTYSCKSMRSFKQFLVAMDINKSGSRYPHMVKWSHPADPGAVPPTWDPADVTKDAGEYELKESGGFLIDSAPLRDINVLYKEDSIWGQQYIGGVPVFRFYNIFRTIGAISRRCSGELFSGVHVVLGFDDMIYHNGQTAQSILDKKLRRYIYSNIDSDYAKRSFIVINTANRTVWFCYPETGNAFPNMALVWDMNANTTGLRELQQCPHIESGQVDPGVTSDQWDSAVGDWSSDAETWGERLYTPAKNRLLILSKDNSKLLLGDSGNVFDTGSITATLERRNLGIPLKVDRPPDFTTNKFWTRIWPHLTGTIGGVVKVYVGTQKYVGADPVYDTGQDFTIGTTKFIDVRANSPVHAIKFESTTDISWRMSAYDVELRMAGRTVR